MSHTIDLSVRVNQSAREVLHVELSDQDHDTLRQFLRAFDRLADSRLGIGMSVKARIGWDHREGFSSSAELPPAEDIAALLHLLRPFLLQREPTSFTKVCGVLGRGLPHVGMRALLRQQQQEFHGRTFQSQIEFRANDVVLNSERILMLWLNAFEYHQDPDKQLELAKLHELLPLDATRPLFVSMLIDKSRALGEVAKIVRIVLGQGQRGQETRFGGLDLQGPAKEP